MLEGRGKNFLDVRYFFMISFRPEGWSENFPFSWDKNISWVRFRVWEEGKFQVRDKRKFSLGLV